MMVEKRIADLFFSGDGAIVCVDAVAVKGGWGNFRAAFLADGNGYLDILRPDGVTLRVQKVDDGMIRRLQEATGVVVVEAEGGHEVREYLGTWAR